MSALEIGKKYRDGWGAVFEIGGLTKAYPEWVYSIQGEWFRKSDGRHILYDVKKGSYPCDRPTNYDIHQCTHDHPIESAENFKYIPVCRMCGHDATKETS